MARGRSGRLAPGQRLLSPAKRQELGRGDRLAEQESLVRVAAVMRKEIELGLRAHPFGDHLEVETARKSDDRLGDCRVAVSVSRSAMKEMSIFSVSIGKCFRCVSDE